MDSNPQGTEPLQFETAVPAVTSPDTGDARTGVTCMACQRTIDVEYFDLNGQPVCEACRTQITAHATTPKGIGVLARAGLFGLGAAILGAVLYYAVIAIANLEIGIVAIAIGYMVGYAVRMATGGRGGRRFQVLALLLTYWAVGLAYTPLAFQQMTGSGGEATASSEAAPAPEAALGPEPANAEGSPEDMSLMLAVAALLVLSMALPVLVVIGSMPSGLISAAIIAFGMHQAWQMTAAPTVQITGPYRIATEVPASV